jgi:hypothetical protein
MTTLGATLSTVELQASTSSPTPGATVTIAVSNNLIRQVFYWTAGEAETINISGDHPLGKEIILIITNDATLGRVLTLGTGLIGTAATIIGVISKVSIAKFISNGTSFYELSRSVGI